MGGFLDFLNSEASIRTCYRAFMFDYTKIVVVEVGVPMHALVDRELEDVTVG
jgi:hypothetical protein